MFEEDALVPLVGLLGKKLYVDGFVLGWSWILNEIIRVGVIIKITLRVGFVLGVVCLKTPRSED